MDSGRNSKSSIELRVTAADVAALRRQHRRVTPEEYARMLEQLPVPIETLRRRNPTRGERFRL